MADSVEVLLSRIRAQLDLDAETEQEVLAEIRTHLQEELEVARQSGLDETQALASVAARFGVDDVGVQLHQTHAGWGTADAVFAAALPTTCALVLRWLAYAPDGTALGWPQLLNRPSFWVVALLMLVLPLARFGRWRYAVAGWCIFWALTVAHVVLPAIRW